MTSPSAANLLPFEAPSRDFERRRYRRFSVPHIRAQPDGKRVEILDMSPHGMAVETTYPFAIGASYLFELFDEGRSLVVEGEVRWCERRSSARRHEESSPGATAYRTGIFFIGLQSRSRAISTPPERRPQLPAVDEEGAEELINDRLERLRTATTADDAAETLLDLLSRDFEHLVLFRIRHHRLSAWLGRGPTLVPERLRRLSLDIDQVSILVHLQQGGSFYYGLLPGMLAHLQLLRCWQGDLERECVLFPIRLNERLVAVLYADAGQETLSPAHLASLKEAVDRFTRSLVDQILRRKAADRPPGGSV